MKQKKLVISGLVAVAIVVLSQIFMLSDGKVADNIVEKVVSHVQIPESVQNAFGNSSSLFPMDEFSPMLRGMIESALDQKNRLLFKSVWFDVGYGQKPVFIGYNLCGTIIYSSEFEKHLEENLSF